MFTVGELIAELSKQDPDALVVTNVWRDDETETVVGTAAVVMPVSAGVAIKGDEYV